ncbi:hypothetical protein O9992_20810 [Vibrio lentus]|nr:hypothetical protein [Vibrio lentus]
MLAANQVLESVELTRRTSGLFYVDVPENTTHFEVSIEGNAIDQRSQGDADLYMGYNKEAHYC